MTTARLYGIKNCDTMKKAMRWLDEHGVAYDFHDYKKDGADIAVLTQAIDTYHWKQVINQRGTTWRQLPDDVRDTMDEMMARTVAMSNPSIIKRPLLVKDGEVYLGFDQSEYEELFKAA